MSVVNLMGWLKFWVPKMIGMQLNSKGGNANECKRKRGPS